MIVALASSAAGQSASPSFLAYVHVIQVNAQHTGDMDACTIVGVDGQYRYEISPPVERPSSANRVYRGHLSEAMFARFKSLLRAPELRVIQSSQPRGSLLASANYQTVSLRILSSGETQEIVFTTVDGRNKMPAALNAFVPWMKDLQKSLGKPDRRAAARGCSGLDATPDFKPELQKR